MTLDGSLDWRRLGRTLAATVLLVVGVALVARALPIPDSPFLLGATVAVVYWLIRRSRIGV